jgi:hypothetical protein
MGYVKYGKRLLFLLTTAYLAGAIYAQRIHPFTFFQKPLRIQFILKSSVDGVQSA